MTFQAVAALDLFFCRVGPGGVRVIDPVTAVVISDSTEQYVSPKFGALTPHEMKGEGLTVLNRYQIDAVDFASDDQNVSVVHEIIPQQ